ncbi:MAG: M23 family metallopeptidase [candidate division WOR-3 bacterium]
MKKGYSIVFSSTNSSISKHFFLSKKVFFSFVTLFLVLLVFLVLGLVKYGTLSYRIIELEILRKQNADMQREFGKLETIKKKLELAEAENQKIRMMLGIDKTPAEVSPSINEVENQYEKEMNNQGKIENLPYLLPVIGQISRKFSEEHKGIDIAGPLYSPVISAASGTVTALGWDSLYGNYVIIEHSFNYKTFYGHLDSIIVKRGDAVTGGKIIGTLGSTGQSTSPHLHYEVIFQGKPVDPMVYLPTKTEIKGGL